MTTLKKRLAVLALGLAVTAPASPSYARGAGRHIRASDPTTLLAPPTPQAPLENRIPAPRRGRLPAHSLAMLARSRRAPRQAQPDVSSR